MAHSYRGSSHYLDDLWAVVGREIFEYDSINGHSRKGLSRVVGITSTALYLILASSNGAMAAGGILFALMLGIPPFVISPEAISKVFAKHKDEALLPLHLFFLALGSWGIAYTLSPYVFQSSIGALSTYNFVASTCDLIQSYQNDEEFFTAQNIINFLVLGASALGIVYGTSGNKYIGCLVKHVSSGAYKLISGDFQGVLAEVKGYAYDMNGIKPIGSTF